MEACCGAYHLGRLFAADGHDVRLMSPEYVRPYVKAQKNDDRDAEGIAEAVVAFANKLARIAWAVLRRGERFAVKGSLMAA
jgi:transposase